MAERFGLLGNDKASLDAYVDIVRQASDHDQWRICGQVAVLGDAAAHKEPNDCKAFSECQVHLI